MAAKTKRQEIEEHERAGPAVSRERASLDYEQPREDVADMPKPVQLPTSKARAGETRGHMRIVLTVGIVLAIAAFVFGYLLVE
jgi:hypothetical protein